MTRPVSKSDLARSAAKVGKLEADLEVARARVDLLLFDAHEAGETIAELARVTGLSRESVYKAIRRHRAQLDT